MVAPALGADLRADTSDIHPPQMRAELVVMQGLAAAGLVIAYKRILGDMRELQSTDHRLLITFCYRHLPPDRKGITSRVTEPEPGPGPGNWARAGFPWPPSRHRLARLSGQAGQPGRVIP